MPSLPYSPCTSRCGCLNAIATFCAQNSSIVLTTSGITFCGSCYGDQGRAMDVSYTLASSINGSFTLPFLSGTTYQLILSNFVTISRFSYAVGTCLGTLLGTTLLDLTISAQLTCSPNTSLGDAFWDVNMIFLPNPAISGGIIFNSGGVQVGSPIVNSQTGTCLTATPPFIPATAGKGLNGSATITP